MSGDAVVFIDTDDDIMPWPNCDRMDPPQSHDPIRTNALRDHRGKFQRAFYCCENCDRALGYMERA